MKPIIHFEDGLTRPDVFRITRAQVNAARRRNPAAAGLLGFSFGNDLETIDRWLPRAQGLVISGASSPSRASRCANWPPAPRNCAGSM